MADEPIGMILAAGYGTRLRPLTLLRAKSAVPFLNRPLVGHAQDLLAKAGVREVVVNLHHLPETVKRAVSGELSDRVHFSREDPIQGTAGALRQARKWLSGRTIVLVNGKIYFEEALENAIRFHRVRKASVTMVLVPYEADAPFNPVLYDADNRILGFASGRVARPPAEADVASGFRYGVFTGVHILAPEFLDYVPEGVCDTVRDVYPRLIAEGHSVLAFVSRAYWCEASTPSRYLSKSLEVLRRKGVTCLPPAPAGTPWVRSVLGSEVRVAPEVELRDCILWDRVEIAAGNRCAGTIVTEEVRIPPDQGDLTHCVITRGGDWIAGASPNEVVDRGEYAVWPLPSEARARMHRDQQ